MADAPGLTEMAGTHLTFRPAARPAPQQRAWPGEGAANSRPARDTAARKPAASSLRLALDTALPPHPPSSPGFSRRSAPMWLRVSGKVSEIGIEILAENEYCGMHGHVQHGREGCNRV